MTARTRHPGKFLDDTEMGMSEESDESFPRDDE